MIHKVRVDLQPRILELELDENLAPKTVRSIIDLLPITVPIHVWGEEIYTDPIPVKVSSENSKDVVDLYDVAYWPPGNAICLFFGPTPMGTKDEIKPYSPVNVIGKIKETDKNLLKNIKDGTKVRFY
jgi:hypothetical protein